MSPAWSPRPSTLPSPLPNPARSPLPSAGESPPPSPLPSRARRRRRLAVRRRILPLLIGGLGLASSQLPARATGPASGVGGTLIVSDWSVAPLVPSLPPEAQVNAERGFAVACDGNLAAVGARFDGPDRGGAAYLFAWNGSRWDEVALANVLPFFGRPGEQLGSSVALHGTTLVVGAPGEERGSGRPGGAFYVITLDFESAPGSARSAVRGARIARIAGSAASIAGGISVARGASSARVDRGAGADRSAGVARRGAVAARSAGDFSLGRAMALDDVRLAVSATMRDDAGEPGVVLLYTLPFTTGDQPAAVLQPDDPQPGDRFGESLALRGGILVAGAPGHRGAAGQPEAGAAYVFLPVVPPAGTRQTAKLQAADETAHAELGSAVAVDVAGSGPTVAAGAAGAPGSVAPGGTAVRSGAVYVFASAGDGWTQQAKLAPGTGTGAAAGDRFGQTVALDGDTLVAGAPLHAAAATVSPPVAGAPAGGAIYFFARAAGAWSELPVAAGAAASPHALYGFALAASAGLVVAGAPLANGTTGAAYAWSRVVVVFGARRPRAGPEPR
jgi:hypothetical protein